MVRIWLVLCLFVPFFLSACDDDTSTKAPGEAWTLDRGRANDVTSDVGNESTMVRPPPTPDAGAVDTGVDATARPDGSVSDLGTDLPPSGPTALRLLGNGNPLASVPVVFSDPLGRVLEVVPTDSDGVATCTTPYASLATFGLGSGAFYNPYRLISVDDLRAGETVVFRLGPSEGTVSTGELSVQLPNPFPGADWYVGG
jgi:hypothetical protein